jgi:uncharacterized membrane protein YoaK (UPF0700 family)
MGRDGNGDAAAAQDARKKRQKYLQHNTLFALVVLGGITGGVVARFYYEKSLWSSFKWALLGGKGISEPARPVECRDVS